MSEFVPGVVFHPSEYIAEEAIERGWSLADFVRQSEPDPARWPLQIASWEFYATCDRDLLMGEDGARALERAFGPSKDFWLRLEAAWRANADRHSPLEQKHRDWYGLDDEVPDTAAAPSGGRGDAT